MENEPLVVSAFQYAGLTHLQAIILSMYQDGWKQNEIADEFRISKSAVSKHIRTAKKKLRKTSSKAKLTK